MTESVKLEQLTEWRRVEVQAIGAAISTRNWHNLEAAYNALRDKMDRVIHAPPATRHQPQEREAVLGLEWSEDGYSLRTPYDGDVSDDTGQHIVVGGETVVTFADSDEGERAREWFLAALTTPAPAERPSTRTAVMGEGAKSAPAVLDDEVDELLYSVFRMPLSNKGGELVRWRKTMSGRLSAILSRLRGEGETQASRQSAIAELCEGLRAAIELLDDCEIAHPFRWDALLSKHSPDAPGDAGTRAIEPSDGDKR